MRGGFYIYAMKRLYFLFLTSLTILGMACQTENKISTDGYKHYSSDSLRLEIDYPQNFEAKEYFNQYVPISFFETITDSVNDRYPENVLLNIEPLPVPVPFADYMQASKTELKLMIPELNIFDEDSTEIDNIKVGSYKFTRPKVDSNNFESKMVVFFQKERAVIFSCTGMAAKFDKYEPIFDKMMQSVKLKKK